MVQTVTAVDGTVHEFPDEATPAMIAGALNVRPPNADGSPPFPTASQQSGAPWWLAGLGNGATMGHGPELQAAAAATKESLTGGLPWGRAYDQALSTYRNAAQQQQQAHPLGVPAATVAGSILTLLAGGEVVNGALRLLGPVGEFLAGDAVVPSVTRAAGGRFRALTEAEKAAALNSGRNVAAKVAQGAREGAQAGAYGAETNDQDPVTGAVHGGLTGGVLSAAVPLATGAASWLTQMPGRVIGMLPDSLKKYGGLAAGVVGGEHLLGNAGEYLGQVAAHPLATAAAVGTGATLLGARYLDANPGVRNLLTRLGILGAGASGVPPAAPDGLLAGALPPIR